jgi:hypothetical protein
VGTPCAGVSEEVEDGGTVTTDPDDEGPRPGLGVFETTSLTVPEGVSGDVSIDLSAPEGSCPLFTELIATTNQPAGTVKRPLTLVFRFDACAIPSGTDIRHTTMSWDGGSKATPNEFEPLTKCRGNHARPDPCVRKKRVLQDGSFQYTVLWSGTNDPSWRPR